MDAILAQVHALDVLQEVVDEVPHERRFDFLLEELSQCHAVILADHGPVVFIDGELPQNMFFVLPRYPHESI